MRRNIKIHKTTPFIPPATVNCKHNDMTPFLAEATDREILQDSGKVTAEIAKAHAESEFEKYRIVQDHLFESDFDKMLNTNDTDPDQ